MKGARRLVLLAGTALFLVWTVLYSLRSGPEDPDWLIRLVLGTLFAILLLLRKKKGEPGADAEGGGAAEPGSGGWRLPAVAAGGAVLSLVGIIGPVHQFEWIGVLALLYACFRWALPAPFRRDLLLAVFVLYWIHPLPGGIQGKLQLVMQGLSVQGAEWLLQSANVRVWADGFWLRTGGQVFGVPESCSGLRTVVTVLLYVLGVGLLFRLRGYQTIIVLAAGLLQALLLNILRIAFMVVWAPRMPAEWAETFLHDTLGLFLLTTIIVAQAELSAWRAVRERKRRLAEAREKGEAEPEDLASRVPRAWVLLRGWLWLIFLGAAAAGALGFLGWKRRPEHRGMMIRDVAESLAETDPASAERALDAVRRIRGTDRSLQVLRAQVLICRGKYPEALDTIRGLSGPPDTLETLIRSWALAGMGRLDEAIVLIEGLPAYMQEEPGVAILRAEYAARKGRPGEVSRHLVMASQSHRTIDRVRKLFPYLVAHEQWKTIVECRSPHPFKHLPHALMAIEAELRASNVGAAAEVLDRAWSQWPQDARLTACLFALARVQPDSPWEERFAQTLKAGLPTLDADQLESFIDYSFRLVRPDLAWMACRRLEELDARDPALHLAAAQYGGAWFTFRRHQLGMEAATRGAVVDLRGEYAAKRNDPEFRAKWAEVPLAEEMIREDLDAVRRKHLDLGLRELEQREKDDKLTYRMEFAFPSALLAAGRDEEALARLAALEKRHPERRVDLILQEAAVYNRQARWQELYETLRRHRENAGQTPLQGDLLTARALLNLNLGVSALDTARNAVRRFPDSGSAELAEAAVWDAFGFKDQALFVLTRGGETRESPALAQLLYDTGRKAEAEKVASRLGIRVVPTPDDGTRGRVFIAELTVTNRWPEPLSDAEMSQLGVESQAAAGRAVSPFMRTIHELEARWSRERGKGEGSDPEAWRRAGRDAQEQAAALYRLTTLLVGARDTEGARRAVEAALGLKPDSPILRRIRIALSNGDPKTVADARAACPDDPEIWLAWLVTRVRTGAADPALAGELEGNVRAAVAAERFPAETLVRAGDFLLRRGFPGPASIAARDAARRARGFVPAHVLALQCALATKDLKWARTSALAGVDHADDPRPFYEMIARLSFAQKTPDSELVAALEYLRQRAPRDPEWAERLGHLYLQKGDPARALAVLGPVLDDDLKGVRLQSLLLAAEAERLEGKPERAVRILKAAEAAHPGTLSVLNNLVYALALDPRTAARAAERLPELLKLGGDSFAVCDTATLVCLKTGRLDDAEAYMKKALAGIDEKSYAAPEVKLNAARIHLARGRTQEAERYLQEALKSPRVTKVVETEARKLLRDIADVQLEQAAEEAERLIGQGKFEDAGRTLKTVLANPNCSGTLEEKVRKLLESLDQAKKAQ